MTVTFCGSRKRALKSALIPPSMVAEREHGNRRAAWRLVASVEQKENFVDNEQPATCDGLRRESGSWMSGGPWLRVRADGQEPHSIGRCERLKGVVLQNEGDG